MNCVIMPVRQARSHVCACTGGDETLWTARIQESATSVEANPQRCFDMYVFSVDIVIDAGRGVARRFAGTHSTWIWRAQAACLAATAFPSYKWSRPEEKTSMKRLAAPVVLVVTLTVLSVFAGTTGSRATL